MFLQNKEKNIMSNKEIVEGLTSCVNKNCFNCPYRNDPMCRASLLKDAADKLRKKSDE